MSELSARNPQITTKFKRLSETSFAAFIYESGKRVSECSVYYGGGGYTSSEIAYSNSGKDQRNSYNETLSVIDDGYVLQLKPFGMPIGMPMLGELRDESLSQQGAAEYYWSLFIRPLQ